MLGFLRCRVSKGMFSNERVIELKLKNGKILTFVVESSDVTEANTSGCGAVKVWVNIEEGDRWAMLPTPQRDLVRFEESDLVPA
jgi:hypothetical protein